MAKAKLVAKVTADISNFKKNMGSIGGIAKSATTLVIGAMVAASAAVAKFGKVSLDAASDFETLESKIKVALGDSEQGAAVFAKIREEASRLPIDTKPAIDSFNTLLNLAGKDIALEQWKNFAALAQLMDVSAKEAGAAIGQLYMKLQRGETSGIAQTLGSQEVAKIFGNETAALIKLADAGATAEQMITAMNAALDKRGSHALDELSKTRKGKEGVLRGLITEKSAQAGGEALTQYKKILDKIIDVIGKLDMSKASESFGQFGEMINSWVSGGQFESLVNLLLKAIPLITDIATLAGEGSIQIAKLFQPLIDALTLILELYGKIKELGGFVADKLISDYKGEGAPTKDEIQRFKNRDKQPQKVVVVDQDGANVYAT